MTQTDQLNGAASIDELIVLLNSTEKTQTDTGRSSHVVTTKGGQVKTAFKVVDASSLIISNNQDGTINPAFPAELQPRDRTRLASKLQVQKIAASLRPEQLTDSGLSSQGSPIIGPDNVVESGNGRSMGIVRAYQQGQADDYRQFLIDHAADYGLSADEISKFKQPVLVRERQTDVDRAQFARDSNLSDLQEMSASEKAFSDSQFLSDNTMALFAPSDDGNLLAKSNMSFIHAFLREIGDNASAGLLTEDGRPTKQLIDRLQNAIFAKAYKDDRLVKLVSEEPDPDMRNILTALNVAASDFAQMSRVSGDNHKSTVSGLVDGIENVDDLDQQAIAALQEAINLVREAKDNGQAIEEVIAQRGLFEESTKEAESLALFIVSNNRSAKRMGAAFKLLASKINEEITHQQQAIGDMFGQVPVDLKSILSAVSAQIEDEFGEGKGLNFAMFEAAGGRKTLKDVLGGCTNCDDIEHVIDMLEPELSDYSRYAAAVNLLSSTTPDNQAALATYQKIAASVLPPSVRGINQSNMWIVANYFLGVFPTLKEYKALFLDGSPYQYLSLINHLIGEQYAVTDENIAMARQVSTMIYSFVKSNGLLPNIVQAVLKTQSIQWADVKPILDLAQKVSVESQITPQEAAERKDATIATGDKVISGAKPMEDRQETLKNNILANNDEAVSLIEKYGGIDAIYKACGYSANIENILAVAIGSFAGSYEMNKALLTIPTLDDGKFEQFDTFVKNYPDLYQSLTELRLKALSGKGAEAQGPDATAEPGTIPKVLSDMMESSSISKEQGDKFAQSINIPKTDQAYFDKVYGKGTVQENLSMIYRLVGGKLTTLKSIRLDKRKRGRSYASVSESLVVMRKGAGMDVLWHEIGHHIEFSNPVLLQMVKEHLRSRKINDRMIVSGTGSDAEYYFNCDFSHQYAGRSYNDVGNINDIDSLPCTEVISMGIQALVNPDYGRPSLEKGDNIVQLIVGYMQEAQRG
ncbi:hypothetical protein [Tatumella sp. OPLPL6]|uniref:hypothetical protein n=1 Tax=Tatumella sp. OPLPL6 TaxID=1928657 RepID=UPI00143BA272|nr:hypothetical protein [Tatumella sp. OPLPL6]